MNGRSVNRSQIPVLSEWSSSTIELEPWVVGYYSMHHVWRHGVQCWCSRWLTAGGWSIHHGKLVAAPGGATAGPGSPESPPLQFISASCQGGLFQLKDWTKSVPTPNGCSVAHHMFRFGMAAATAVEEDAALVCRDVSGATFFSHEYRTPGQISCAEFKLQALRSNYKRSCLSLCGLLQRLPSIESRVHHSTFRSTRGNCRLT